MARSLEGHGAPRPSRPHRFAAASVACLLSVAAASLPAVDSSAGEAELQRARRAAQSLNDQVRERMESRIRDGGPAAALKVCTYQAAGILRDLEQTQGVSLKRASLKPRSPANAPDPWERAVLQKYSDASRKGYGMEEVFERVEGPGGGKGTWRYARPIVLQKGCLVCHGSPSDIPPEVAEGLREKYPSDGATGYGAGDLLGIVSVSFPE